MKKILVLVLALLTLGACVSNSGRYRFVQDGSAQVKVAGLSLREQAGHMHIQGLLFQHRMHTPHQQGVVDVEVYDANEKLVSRTIAHYDPPLNPQREWRFTGVRFKGVLDAVPPKGSLLKVSFRPVLTVP